jgi:hypothetical protein
MALRDHVEGRESVIVAVFSVVIWVGMCLVFGLPSIMIWIVAVLLFIGGVVKSGSSPADDSPADEGPAPTAKRGRRRGKKSIYGPPD